VADADWEALAHGGKIGPATLVWREGMAEWLPYGQVNSTPAGASPLMAAPVTVAPGQALCSECGQAFPPDEVIRHGDQFICATCKPIFLQKLKEGVVPQAAVKFAGFWIRFLAFVIDGIVVTLLSTSITCAIRAATGGRVDPFETSALDNNMGLLFMAVYNTVLVRMFGATLGKMATGLRIVNADGSPISYGKALGRWAAQIVSQLICFLGYVMIVWDDEKRALHDRICNTRVIRK
jgi:uncharacterized RDD family membrane protein YckC